MQPGEPVIVDSLGKESETENQEDRGEEEIGCVEVDEYDTSSDEGSNDEVHEKPCENFGAKRQFSPQNCLSILEERSDFIIDFCFKMHPCKHFKVYF